MQRSHWAVYFLCWMAMIVALSAGAGAISFPLLGSPWKDNDKEERRKHPSQEFTWSAHPTVKVSRSKSTQFWLFASS
jgi:hypothetical protein